MTIKEWSIIGAILTATAILLPWIIMSMSWILNNAAFYIKYCEWVEKLFK